MFEVTPNLVMLVEAGENYNKTPSQLFRTVFSVFRLLYVGSDPLK